MMTVVAYWRVETIVSKYSHCRILSKFWWPKNLGHERRRRLNKSQPSLWKQQQPPPRVFFSFQKSYLIWDLPDMICADKKQKNNFVVRYVYTDCKPLSATLNSFWRDSLTFSTWRSGWERGKTQELLLGPLRGCISLLSAVVVGLSNIVVGLIKTQIGPILRETRKLLLLMCST